jgi:hypothetical protein
MTEKDKQELDVLRIHVQKLLMDADRRDHELRMLHKCVTEQEDQLDRLSRLLAMLGLLPDDLDAPGALTSKATLLLRLSRPDN